MRRIVLLLVLALFSSWRPAFADATCEEAKALRGPVQSVVVKKVGVDAVTRAPRNVPYVWERWEISRDRRTITVMQYSDPGPPTTVCEFDSGGKLVRSVVKLDGRTEYTRVEYEYDEQGRLTVERSKSKNPEFTRVFRTEYRGDAVIEYPALGDPKATRTTRDDEGRITRETRWNAADGAELSDVAFRYSPDGVEVTGRENGHVWRIRKTLDHMGNVVAGSSSAVGHETRTTGSYAYDAEGNWVEAVSAMSVGSMPAPKTVEMTIREISYYPEP